MVEKVYNYKLDDESIVEKIIDNKDVSIAHAIVKSGEAFPTHHSNADVKVIIVKGELSMIADAQQLHKYSKGDIIEIPNNTELTLSNNGQESLEFFAIKTPSPTFN